MDRTGGEAGWLLRKLIWKRWLLPFGIYVDYAAADGYHTSMLPRDIQDMCDQCKDWIQ